MPAHGRSGPTWSWWSFAGSTGSHCCKYQSCNWPYTMWPWLEMPAHGRSGPTWSWWNIARSAGSYCCKYQSRVTGLIPCDLDPTCQHMADLAQHDLDEALPALQEAIAVSIKVVWLALYHVILTRHASTWQIWPNTILMKRCRLYRKPLL